jgi:hypothetical protein
MEELTRDGDYIESLIEFDGGQDFEAHMSFKVYEVESWNSENIPQERELYLKGTIKWDGCSHIYFGNEDNDGYIHMCGKGCFNKHIEIINALWELARTKIKGWYEEVAN